MLTARLDAVVARAKQLDAEGIAHLTHIVTFVITQRWLMVEMQVLSVPMFRCLTGAVRGDGSTWERGTTDRENALVYQHVDKSLPEGVPGFRVPTLVTAATLLFCLPAAGGASTSWDVGATVTSAGTKGCCRHLPQRLQPETLLEDGDLSVRPNLVQC